MEEEVKLSDCLKMIKKEIEIYGDCQVRTISYDHEKAGSKCVMLMDGKPITKKQFKEYIKSKKIS